MENYKTEKRKINGAFLLLCIVKILIVGLGYAASYILVSLTGTGTFYQKVVGDLSGYDTVTGQLFNFALYVLGAGIPVIIYFALRGKPTEKGSGVLLARPTFFQTGYAVGATALVGGTVSAVWNMILSYLYAVIGYDPYYYYGGASGNPSSVWLMAPFFILVAFLPALIEEFIMRGAVLSSMRKFGRVFTVLMSGLLFMMMHNTLEQMALSFAAGICLAYFTLKFRSIWVAVMAHFVINLNSCILGLIYEMFDGAYLLIIYVGYTVAYLTLMLGFTVAGPILYGVKLPPLDKPSEEDRKGTLRSVFTSPFFYIFIAMFLYVLYTNVRDILAVIQ